MKEHETKYDELVQISYQKSQLAYKMKLMHQQ